MPKLTDGEIEPRDLLLDDLSDELLDRVEQQASALGIPFSKHFLDLFAMCIGVAPHRLAGATAIRIDTE